MCCYYKFISTECHCYFLLYCQILVYCNISLSYTFKSTYIIIKACGSWSPLRPRGIFILHQTLDFEIQTLQLAFQTSKFWLQTCSLHDNVVVHTGPNHPFQNYFNREDCTVSHVWHRLGVINQPNLLNGSLIIYLRQLLVAIGPLHDFILFLGPNFLVLVMMETICDDW